MRCCTLSKRRFADKLTPSPLLIFISVWIHLSLILIADAIDTRHAGARSENVQSLASEGFIMGLRLDWGVDMPKQPRGRSRTATALTALAKSRAFLREFWRWFSGEDAGSLPLSNLDEALLCGPEITQNWMAPDPGLSLPLVWIPVKHYLRETSETPQTAASPQFPQTPPSFQLLQLSQQQLAVPPLHRRALRRPQRGFCVTQYSVRRPSARRAYRRGRLPQRPSAQA